MPNQDYIPTDDEGKAALFERFRDTIPSYATALGVSAGEVADQAEDATWFRYILNHARSMQDAGSQWTNYKSNLLSGSDATATKPATFSEVTSIPSTVAPGILTRFRDLVRQAKAATAYTDAYTDAIGEAIGIIGSENTPKALSVTAPQIKLRLNGGKIKVLGGNQSDEVNISEYPASRLLEYRVPA